MQKFSYTPSNPFSGSVSSLAIGAGMVVVPLVYPFGIRIGRMRILGPTAVTIIFVIGGLALLHSRSAKSCRPANSSPKAARSPWRAAR